MLTARCVSAMSCAFSLSACGQIREEQSRDLARGHDSILPLALFSHQNSPFQQPLHAPKASAMLHVRRETRQQAAGIDAPLQRALIHRHSDDTQHTIAFEEL